MPKITDNILGISGKLGKHIFVNSRTNGTYMRAASRAQSKKRIDALKQNYSRTALLNRLASDINRIAGSQTGGIKHSNFYFELHKRFRKQTGNNRYVLLSTLKGMDLHPRYTINKLCGSQDVAINSQKHKIRVTLKVQAHPYNSSHADCYSYDLLLVTWEKGNSAAKFQRQFSDWIYLKDGRPEFDFVFSRGNTIHWLLCLRQLMGVNEKEISLKLQGMQIIDIGTFNKKDEALLKKARNNQKTAPAVKKNSITRVKPNRFN